MNWLLEEWKKGTWSSESRLFFSAQCGSPGMCVSFTWRSDGGSVMLQAMFCCETLESSHSCGPYFDVNPPNWLVIVANQPCYCSNHQTKHYENTPIYISVISKTTVYFTGLVLQSHSGHILRSLHLSRKLHNYYIKYFYKF